LFSKNRFCSVSVWDLLRLIPLIFWYEIFTRHSTLCIEFWMRFEPQIHPTRIAINFLFITTRVERKVRLCVKLFHFFPRWILIRLTWNLSLLIPISVEILTWNFNKKLFRENFPKFLCKPKIPKLFTQVLSYVVCTLLSRNFHKRITKSRYIEENAERFVFEKPVLFTLSLRLTTPYSPDLLVWNFYQKFIIFCIEFWLRF